MKHHGHLSELDALLSKANLAGIPALIIDDEADQAGLDTSARARSSAGSGVPSSTTYSCIKAVRARLLRHTYLQYTATPQAPLLISLADTLSPEFADVIQPGEGYTGGRDFFLDRPNLVRTIPPSDLTVGSGNSGPPESLLGALRIFFVGVACHMIDPRGEQRRSMLIHPSRLTPTQGQYSQWVASITSRWRRVLQLPPGDGEREELLDELRASYVDLQSTESRMPPFQDLVGKMPVAANRLIVTEINSETGQEVEWNKGPYHVLIGGEKMSRGYTVRGLTVTYMPRPPGTWTADTIQQRARFFGYKAKYVGFCRIFLPSDIIVAYRTYVEHEENIRDQLTVFRGKPLKAWRRAFFLEAPYQPTRRNVLADPYFKVPAPQGWFEQQRPHYSSESIASNRRLVEKLVSQYTFVPHELDRHAVCRSVPLAQVLRDFLVEFAFIGDHDAKGSMAALCRISDHVADHPGAICTIVQMDANRDRLRRRTARDDDEEIDLQQGRDPKGRSYPGDAAVRDTGRVTIQIHRVDIDLSDGRTEGNVAALAIYIPPEMTGDVLVSPR